MTAAVTARPAAGESANPDAGARIVSPNVALAEARLPGSPYVTGLAVVGDAAIVASGDGGLWRLDLEAERPEPARIAETGALPLALVADPAGAGVIVGTDSGRLLAVSPEGRVRTLAFQAGGWFEHVAVHAASGRIACSVGRRILCLDAAGALLAERDGCPSTVAGLAFSADGARIAAAHYGGVSVWPAAGGHAHAERLPWHGSHTVVAWSPDGRFIATAMQEKELHAWRMPQAKSLRMSGYPAKIRSLSWTPDSRWLAVGGADVVTAWDFGGDGPSGKAPLEFGYVFNQVVTEVAASPAGGHIAGAYDDGAVLIGDIASSDAMIARPGDGAAVSRLAWSADGRALVAGTARGGLAVMRLRRPGASA